MVKWYDLSARAGRNDLPQILVNAVFLERTLFDPDEIRKGVSDAWVMAEWPGRVMEYGIWVKLFEMGRFPGEYIHERTTARISELPETVSLWRGADPSAKKGMSWTDDFDRAHWFATRISRFSTSRPGVVPQVYRAEVPREGVLARFDERRGEREWVIHPEHLKPVKVDTADYERLLQEAKELSKVE